MSVYRRQGQDEYSYDFRLRGGRFSGRTGETARRAAERIEALEREKARAELARAKGPLSVELATSRYWQEIGQHRADADSVLVALDWLKAELGARTYLSAITADDVARLVAKRRAEPAQHRRGPDGGPRPVSPATVNRGVVAPLRAVLTRARTVWGAPVQPIRWGEHFLREPEERVRELTLAEEAAFLAALRPDYRPIVNFLLLSGCRRAEAVALRWRDIDWQAGQLRVTGKGDRSRTIPLTKSLRALLWPLPRAHEQVFVFASARASFARRGTLHPIRPEGLKSIIRRAIARAGIEDFHLHDTRHTRATRLLRQTGNLRLVKDLLGHADLKTTLKYAHVTIDDLRAAMEATENATDIPTATAPTGTTN